LPTAKNWKGGNCSPPFPPSRRRRQPGMNLRALKDKFDNVWNDFFLISFMSTGPTVLWRIKRSRAWTHVIERRMIVNFLEVDIVDGDTFLRLFLEELQRVVLQSSHTSSTLKTRLTHEEEFQRTNNSLNTALPEFLRIPLQTVRYRT